MDVAIHTRFPRWIPESIAGMVRWMRESIAGQARRPRRSSAIRALGPTPGDSEKIRPTH
jgi:hypothetical protein